MHLNNIYRHYTVDRVYRDEWDEQVPFSSQNNIGFIVEIQLRAT